MRARRLYTIMSVFLMMALLTCPLWSGTTGKISGSVIDKATGDPMMGANVIISGTTMGAASDINGDYTILHVPPGLYDIEISVMGYTKLTVTDVRVRIDQTARVDAGLEMEAVEGEAVTIVAARNLIREDVATSVVAVTDREIEQLPVSNVSNVVGLQAGIQNGLEIRGGEANEALFLMDGVTLRDPRNNKPVSTVALSAVKEISIERGGFNAEYGQVRSGIVNVITKEGSKNQYHGNMEFRYSPPAAKNFGISPFDVNSFWLRSYYDDAVCWTGTDNGTLNDYEQLQWLPFEGWNKVSERLMTDDNPDNDLSPLEAQRVFMWETRKQPPLNQPDYNVDAGFGGPIPFLSEKLGNLRFFASYIRDREMLLVPLTRDDYVDYDWTVKVTSDITSSMKLTITGLGGKQFRMAKNWDTNWNTVYNMRYPSEIAGLIEDRPGRLFGTGMFSLTDIGHQGLSAKLTHLLSQKTFYEVSIENFQRKYWTRPPAERNKTDLYEVVPGYFVDEAPFGYDWDDATGIAGMLFGGFTCKKRDNSVASSTTFKVDMTSQVNFSNLVKTGFEFVYNDLKFDYGTIANYKSDEYETHVDDRVFPVRAALYLQDKLETKGFIMNLGLRLDYSDSRADWWEVDPYDRYFFTSKYSDDLEFPTIESKPQWQLSPRLGISHPITENSKLFFNYGYFKQMPSYESLFTISRAMDHRLSAIGDPNLILAKTISYELGYDHSLFNNILIQAAAFYHDIQDQQTTTRYYSTGGIEYDKTTSNSYADIRGFEFTIRKTQGRWMTFFGNYTYQVTTDGHFGREEIYQDPSKQKRYDEATVNLYQERPIPRPYARFNMSLFTPNDYGPRAMGIYPLGGYMLNLLFDWQEGQWVTWNPKDQKGIANNVQQTDNFNALLRFSKTFNFNKFRIMAFVDIDNLFNYKRMSMVNWFGAASDQQYYFYSLHLPESDAYDNIPGDDRVGDYRKDGVDYQPMESKGVIDYEQDTGNEGVIYYDHNTGRYVEYVDEAWVEVESGRLDQLLEDKAYIDMPNMDSFTFLDPRQIYFGLRISFDLNQ